MSFSFKIVATDVASVLAALPSKFAEIIANQPVHEKDCAFGLPVVMTYVSLVTLQPGKELSVSVNGWVQTNEDGVSAVSFGVTVNQSDPPAPADPGPTN